MLTTADVAKRLEVTPRAVRWFIDQGQLRCEQLSSGALLCRPEAVARLTLQRATDRGRRRGEVLRAVRVQMLKAGFQPRQVSLFGPRLKLVGRGPGERSLPTREVKAARSFGKSAESDKPHYGNLRAAGGRR